MGNLRPAQNVVAAAQRFGARVLYVSTSGVYGRSFGRFDDPTRLDVRPTSVLSTARAAAERAVLAAGGSVVRPHVVYGPGDRWFAPLLAKFMLLHDAFIGGPDITVAAITAARLGTGIAGLLDRGVIDPVLHAAEQQPLAVADLVRSTFYEAAKPLPTAAVSVTEAHALLRGSGVSLNAIRMVGESSVMDSRAFWSPAEVGHFS